MKRAIGFLFLAAGYLVPLLTALAAVVFTVFCVLWMHAPLPQVLGMVLLMAVLPVGTGWLSRAAGRSLLDGAGQAAAPRRTWFGAAAIAIGIVCAALALRLPGTGKLARYDIAFLPMAVATWHLAFPPVDLAGTPFARLESLGGRAESVNGVRSRLYRGFRLPDGHRLTLLEHDLSADGVRMRRDPADEPERINGRPARLVVVEDGPGKAVSHLSWAEGRRWYELWIDADAGSERERAPLRARLFALAASLPRAVPACPNEKLQDFDAPPPMVLTDEHDEATAGPRKRPCK